MRRLIDFIRWHFWFRWRDRNLPPNEISADAYMDRPVDSLVWGAAKLAERCCKYADLIAEHGEDESLTKIMATDDQMRTAYLGALRLRSVEVAHHITNDLHVTCTAQQVRDDPFMVCVAVMRRVGGTA